MNNFAKRFQDLLVWQKAHRFVLSTYKMTAVFPSHELYGLTSQLRRAAVSIPANIAEGFRKTGKADRLRFLNIAQGSLEESRYYLILAQDLGYTDVSEQCILLEEVSKMLSAFYKSIKS
ncbi:four helix bundle protein [candidate division NPL-UPA2 bacterium]|nr:four helix bundle protein [candidate division NPL-UPA2 bacterium]